MKNKCRKLICLLFSSSRVNLFVKNQNCRNLSLINLEAKWNLDFHKALKGLINYCHCHFNSRVKAKKTLSGNECPQKSAKQFSPYFPFLESCLYSLFSYDVIKVKKQGIINPFEILVSLVIKASEDLSFCKFSV